MNRKGVAAPWAWLHDRPGALPSEWFDVSGKPHHTADVAAVFKDRTKQNSGTAMAILAVAAPTPL